MPIEVVNAVKRRCNTGKMPAWMRKMKKSKNLSCEQLGETVAGMVKNKRQRARSKVAGERGDDSVLHLYGGDDWVWILASEPDTRLKGLSGERYLVDPTAHMASLPDWLKVKSGHIDHSDSRSKQIQVGEARFDVDKGLYLKVRSDDVDVSKGLRSGTILPSIEIDVKEKDILDNNIIDFYSPVGLGLMVDNEPLGNSVGPEKPNERFSVPIYAGELNMEMETNTNETEVVEAPTEEVAVPTPEAEPEVAEEPPEEPQDELSLLQEAKDALERKLEDVLAQVDLSLIHI